MKRADRDRVAREPAIDLALHVTMCGPVENVCRESSDAEEHQEKSRQPDPSRSK